MARIVKMGSAVVVIASVFAFTLWLRGDLNHDRMISEELIENVPIAYADTKGETVSKKYDSTLYAFPHLLMSSGDLTVNDRCPVRRVRLNARIQPLFVNGRPVGFC